jgi:hypothetical protein
MSKATFETLVGFLILLIFSFEASAQLTVNANRNQYAPRDNIALSVESDNPIESVLDTSPLLNEFIILDQKKMTINSYAEGKRSAKVRWNILLRARKSGSVQIPNLSYNQESSEPFTIFIKSSSPTRFLPVSDLPIILDAQLDKDDSYEGALFLYTLNLYSDRPLAEGFQIAPPKLQKGDIQLLEQSPVELITIRNKEYNVIEQRYAVFPSEMGRFIIEGPIFTGSQQDGINTLVRANNLEINVRSRQDFDNATYWLAANSVTINEEWTKAQTMKVGDVIYREISLTAKGIRAADLPNIITQNPEIINIQDSKVSLTDTINKDGIQGTRIERQQIQLLERGELTFPKIDIFWWSTSSDSQQQAVLPKQIMQVMPGVNGESSIEREVAQNAASINKNNDINVIQTNNNWILWALLTLCSISAIGWLYNFIKMKRLRVNREDSFAKDPTINDSAIAETFSSNDSQADLHDNSEFDIAPDEGEQFNAKAELGSFQLLGRACLDNDLSTANRRLIEWGDYYWFEQPVDSIQDIALCANNPSLNVLLAEMQELLDNRQLNEWEGKSLFSLLTNIRST